MAKPAAAASDNHAHESSSRTVKVSPSVHNRLSQLVAAVSQRGWAHLGIQREDVPTFSTIIEEALNKFGKRKA
jgi:hypothetical protein